MSRSDKPMLPDRGDGVTRRDFLHDLAVAGLVAAAPGSLAAAVGEASSATAASAMGEAYYPPTRTGLRGTHEGAFEVAHALAREGKRFDEGRDTGENYDLVIVGAGISGLAAAYFYRQQHGADKRILLLDNHDDFGGHAKRNEFHQGGSMNLAWGGTVNIEWWNYSDVGNRLLSEIGVDVERLLSNFTYDWGESGTGLDTATWFDEKTYGVNRVVKGMSVQNMQRDAVVAAVPEMPISKAAKDALLRFLNSEEDVLSGYSVEERERFIRSTSYTQFLRDQGGLPDEAIQIFDLAMMGIWGVRTGDLSVAECLYSGLPGEHILGIPPASYEDESHGPSAMFPDGNASITRLLVRSLIPDSFPDMTEDADPFDIVTEQLDYSQLDDDSNAVRLRLNSLVLNVSNEGEGVALTYHQNGDLKAVRAKQCVLACYNRIIPHICPTLPQAQKEGLAECIKRPMGTANVLLKNGKSLVRAGVSSAYLPGSLLQMVSVVTGVNAGKYQTEWNPDEPCMLHFFFGVPPENPGNLSIVEQSQAGRLRLLAMDFEDFEQEIHRVLNGIWGEAGLDVDNDILAITVNRWPHGYARDLIDLEDKKWLASPGPYEIGRKTFGNIAIANSDAGADAYTHTAIDQAWRAVQELPTTA